MAHHAFHQARQISSRLRLLKRRPLLEMLLQLLLRNQLHYRHAADRGPNEDESIYHMRIVERKIDGNLSPQRQPHHIGLFNTKKREQIREVLSISIWHLRQLRFAETAHIVANDAVMLRKYRELVIPHAPVHVTPVNKHKRMALAHHFIIKPRAIRLDKTCFRSIRLSHSVLLFSLLTLLHIIHNLTMAQATRAGAQAWRPSTCPPACVSF